MEKSKYLIMAIIIIFIGYFGYINYQKQSTDQNIDIVNWQTKETNSFLIKYPDNLQANEELNPDQIFIHNSNFTKTLNTYITQSEVPILLSCDRDSFYANDFEIDMVEINYDSCRTLETDNKIAYLYEEGTEIDGQNRSYLYTFVKDNIRIHIMINGMDGQERNEIINSFQLK